MITWKVTLEQDGAIFEFTVKAKTYADAFINAQTKFPDGRITSIRPIESINKK